MEYKPEEDGITHINIYSKGRTELGRLLSNFAPISIDVEEGWFASVEAYWYFLLTGQNALRDFSGFEAKKLGKKLIKIQNIEGSAYVKTLTKEFQDKIKYAFRIKVAKNNGLCEMLAESTLPFAHYYVFDGKIIRPTEFHWQVEEWEKIRRDLQKPLLST